MAMPLETHPELGKHGTPVDSGVSAGSQPLETTPLHITTLTSNTSDTLNTMHTLNTIAKEDVINLETHGNYPAEEPRKHLEQPIEDP